MDQLFTFADLRATVSHVIAHTETAEEIESLLLFLLTLKKAQSGEVTVPLTLGSKKYDADFSLIKNEKKNTTKNKTLHSF